MAKDKNRIPRVESSEQKSDTYKKLLDRHTEAVKSGFYLEAIVLEYAMIEDRFTEILRTLGIATLNEKGTEYVPVIGLGTDLFKLLNPNKTDKKEHGSFKTISSKFEVIKALAEEEKCPETLKLQRECVLAADKAAGVKKDGTRSMAILPLIKELKNWNGLRDQYIHALYSKDYEQAMAILPDTSEQGMKLANEIHSFLGRVVTQAKNRNIRRI